MQRRSRHLELAGDSLQAIDVPAPGNTFTLWRGTIEVERAP